MRKSMYVALVQTDQEMETLIVKARSAGGASIEVEKYYHPRRVQTKIFKPVAVLLVKEREGKDARPLHT